MNKQNQTNKIKHILHPLNRSKSKSAIKFDKSQRFLPEKSYSPAKFYDAPPCFPKSGGYSVGKGQRTKFQKTDSIEPNRYRITSTFDLKGNRNAIRTTFGINRQVQNYGIQQYYKGRQRKTKVGPGAYDIESQLGKMNVYIGKRLSPPKPTYNPPQYDISPESINRLSNHRNQNRSYRIKTQYFPKPQLQSYDNRVPGPGAYIKELAEHRNCRNNSTTTFGVQERLKGCKVSNIGPGKYNIFSEFGQDY